MRGRRRHWKKQCRRRGIVFFDFRFSRAIWGARLSARDYKRMSDRGLLVDRFAAVFEETMRREVFAPLAEIRETFSDDEPSAGG